VIWGVEFYAFDAKFVGFRHPETRKRLEVDDRHVLALRITETLFTFQALRDSSRAPVRAARGKKPETLTHPVPWPEPVIKDRLAGARRRPGLDRARAETIKRQLQDWVVSYVDYRLSDAQLSLFLPPGWRASVGARRVAGRAGMTRRRGVEQERWFAFRSTA
jgi:hypothetical protein